MPSGTGNKGEAGRKEAVMLPLSVDVEDDDSGCDHPTRDGRASGNEDLAGLEMTDAEDLALEEAFEMLLMGSQQPGILKRPFTIGVARTLLCAEFRAAKARGCTPTFKTPMLAPDAWLSSDQLHVYGVHVDGHESEDVVLYRNEYIRIYARDIENLDPNHAYPRLSPLQTVLCTHKWPWACRPDY